MNKFLSSVLGLLLLLIIPRLYAIGNYLPPEQAFQVVVSQLPDNYIDVHFNIASGYDIYQDKISITTGVGSSVKLGKAKFPSAIKKHNEVLGEYYVYQDTADILLPIAQYGDGNLILKVSYQGCKGNDYCYPGISETKQLSLKQLSGVKAVSKTNLPVDSSIRGFLNNKNGSGVVNFFTNSVLMVVLGFFIVGVLLSGSPCVFPMFPILFTIIAGANTSFRRSIYCATSYVLGMASAYALVGIIFATIGSSLQVILQNSITNYILAILFVVFSLSLFGLFEIRLPQVVQNKLFRHNNPRGNLISIFFMGGISTLLLSPCVTAPLAGGLLYIASTGNILLGGLALFCLGIGSGLPLLVMAVFGSRLMPKNGVWLFLIKDLLGFIMLGMGIYILSREITANVVGYLVGGFLLLIGWYFILSPKYANWSKRIILVFIGGLAIFFAGYFIGGRVNNFSLSVVHVRAEPKFIIVTTQRQLERELAIAKQKHLPVLMDFYAKWCVACKELDFKTFGDPSVAKKLAGFYLIKVDISENSPQTKALMNKYQVMAPPSLVFYDRDGNYLQDENIIGYIDSHQLLMILNKIQ